jgi:hypothetical protein
MQRVAERTSEPRHAGVLRGVGPEQIGDAGQLKQPTVLLNEDLRADRNPPLPPLQQLHQGLQLGQQRPAPSRAVVEVIDQARPGKSHIHQLVMGAQPLQRQLTGPLLGDRRPLPAIPRQTPPPRPAAPQCRSEPVDLSPARRLETTLRLMDRSQS